MIEFDWAFDEETLARCNEEIGEFEDEYYGDVLVIFGNDAYIVDIHYEYYSSRNKGFDLEVYKAIRDGDGWTHGQWLDNIRGIKSSKSIKRFKSRAEKLITKYLEERS